MNNCKKCDGKGWISIQAPHKPSGVIMMEIPCDECSIPPKDIKTRSK